MLTYCSNGVKLNRIRTGGHHLKAKARAELTDGIPSGKRLTVCDIEHGPVEILDLPMKQMVIFRCFLYVYQRVMELVDAKPHHCASGLWSSKKKIQNPKKSPLNHIKPPIKPPLFQKPSPSICPFLFVISVISLFKPPFAWMKPQ